MNYSERRSTPVSRDLPMEGLDAGELAALSSEGGFIPKERKMDDKIRDLMTSTLAAAGMWVVWLGWADAQTWATWSGAIMMVLAAVLPFVLPRKA